MTATKSQRLTSVFSSGCCGGPAVIRTRDLRFRKPLLYPSELQGHTFHFNNLQQAVPLFVRYCFGQSGIERTPGFLRFLWKRLRVVSVRYFLGVSEMVTRNLRVAVCVPLHLGLCATSA
jgi:hypothetical protein